MSFVELSKNKSKVKGKKGGATGNRAPGLPYKLRERLMGMNINIEPEVDAEMDAKEKRAFKAFVKDCLIVGVGMGFWFLACFMWGWQYGM